MKTMRVAPKVFAAGLLTLALTPMAHAQATRTWVSGVGDDVNPCSRTAPCKTFAGAISKTAAGGEISVLDPGSFGTVTITKALTIDGNGQLAGILSSGTNGITVNAGVNDRVVIRNLSINGGGALLGLNGIRYLAGKSLTVENVSLGNFSSRGIDVSLAASGTLFVKDTNITNAQTGIRVNTTGGQALTLLDNVRIEGMSLHGIEVAGGNNIATVRNSVISGNAQNGILASGTTAVVNVEDSLVAFNNSNGVISSVAGATIRLSRSSIFNNQVGIGFVVGATVASDGQNRIAGNGSSQAPNGGGTVVVQ